MTPADLDAFAEVLRDLERTLLKGMHMIHAIGTSGEIGGPIIGSMMITTQRMAGAVDALGKLADQITGGE